AGHDHVARLWDPATGRLLRALEGHTNPVHPVLFADKDRLVVTGAWDNTIRVWEAATGKPTRTLKADQIGGIAVAATAGAPDGQAVAAAAKDGVHLYAAEAGKKLRTCGDAGRSVAALAFSPDGKTLASAEGNAVRGWDVADGKALDRGGDGHRGRITCAAFDPDSKLVATGSLDGSVMLWDRTGRPRGRVVVHP